MQSASLAGDTEYEEKSDPIFVPTLAQCPSKWH
jgi:hypothetical protein